MNVVVDNLPEFAAMAGYTVGMVADFYAQHRIAGDRVPVNEELADIVEASQPGVLRRLGGAAMSTLPFYTAATGALIGYAAQPPEPNQITPPGIEVVVDYSGAAGVLNGGKAALSALDYAGAVGNDHDVSSEALVARAGVVNLKRIDEITQTSPVGEAPLMDATQQGMDKAAQARYDIKTETTKSTGVMVLTNGNSIGAPDTVITRSKDTHTPVYIVNVDTATTDPQTVSELQTIADQTGGKYWKAADTNPQEVAQTVAGGLEESATNTNNRSERSPWPGRVLAGVFVAGLPFAYKNRKSMPAILGGVRLKLKQRKEK